MHGCTAQVGVDSPPSDTYLFRREGNTGTRFAMLTTYIATLINHFRGPTQKERELAYLNGSVDRYDLESRQRQIDKGLFWRAE
jgi:hypothetical protein